MSTRNSSQRDRFAAGSEDRGFTLVEVIITIAMVGFVMAVIAAAVSVISRSEDGVTRVSAESHDTQQGVNYFPLDVQAGPTAVAAYDTGIGPTGCDGDGTNVLQFDKGKRRVAYRLVTDGSSVRLDRFTCVDQAETGPPIWGSIERVNIADTLEAVAVPATATVTPDASKPDTVGTVELTLAQHGQIVSVSASPRAEPRDSAGDCQTDNPLEPSHGYGVFVEGDVLLHSGAVTGWLGLGGTIRWESDITIASENMSAVDPSFGLIAGSIDWVGNGDLQEALDVARGNVALGTSFHQAARLVYRDATLTDNFLNLTGPSNPSASTGVPVVFSNDFDELRDCAAQMARLLDLCGATGCANEVEVTVSGATANFCTESPVAQVLNMPEQFWDGSFTFTTTGPGCQGFSQSRPLIINVIDTNDDGEILINTTPADWSALGDRKNILVNFPDSSHVVVQAGFFGELYAPFAHVETTGDFQGGLIAAQWTHHGGTVTSHNDLFDNEIDWPSE